MMRRSALIWVCLLFWGCGRDESLPAAAKPTAQPDSTTPLAVKTVHFGASVREVEKIFKPLEKSSEAQGLAVYTCRQKDAPPILSYSFEFIDGKLSACQVLYDGAAFDSTIDRNEFFAHIEKKYNVKSDFGTSEGIRRWLNVGTQVTVTWQEDLKRKIGVLMVSWDAMEETRKARLSAIGQERKQQASPTPPPKKVDMGI